MSFPISPVDGQTTIVNGITYVYSTTSNSWTRVPTTFVNLDVAGNIVAGGNITGENLYTAGEISAIGNITGNYFIGNGSQLTGVEATNANADSLIGNTLSSNVLYSSLTTVGTLANLSVTGDVNTIGNVSATGNVTGTYILGNGAFLSGVITSVANINNGTSNVTIGVPDGNVTVSVSGVGNIAVFTPTGEYVTGDISATGNIYGNFLITPNTTINGGIVTTGDVSTTGNVSAYGNVTANNISTSGSGGNITGANVISAVTLSASSNVYAQYLITPNTTINGGIVTTGDISTTGNVSAGGNVYIVGNISATGNVTGNYILGDGSQLTGIITPANFYANALVGNTLSSNVLYSSLTSVGVLSNLSVTGDISTTGNISISGNITAANGNFTGNLIPTANITYSLGNSTNQWNELWLSGGTMYIGNLAVGSNGTNLTVNGANVVVSDANGNISGGNLLTTGIVSASGNIAGNYFIGNGTALTGVITPANFYANALVGNTLSSNVLYSSLTSLGTIGNLSVSGNTQSGNLLTTGQISATANITTAAYFVGTFAGSISGNLTAPGSNTQVLYNNSGNAGASAGFTFDQASNAMVVTGNVTGANFLTAGLISATSTITSANNITGANILTAGQVSASGNVNGGNLSVTGNAVIVGNLNVQGNVTFIGSNVITTNDLYIELANNQSTYANINNAGLAVGPTNSPLTYWQYQNASNAWTTNVSISATANIISGNNISATGTITSSANIIGANILTAGLVSATGNIIGNYFIGNGSQLTGVTATNVDANALTGNTLSSNVLFSSLTSVGTLSNLSVSGNTIGGNFLTDGFVSATGTVTAGQFIGNGNTISNIQGANVSGNVTSAVTAGTVTTNAQPNITSVGTLTSVTSSGLVSTTGNLVGANILTDGLISAAANIVSSGNIILNGTGNINGYNGYFSNNLTVLGTLQTTSNITSNGAGIFYGNSITGNNALYAGVPEYTSLGSNVVVQFAANVNNYSQINFQNISNGSASSTDYILTADNGTDTTYFADFGINGSAHTDPAFFGDTTSINDVYLYAVGPGNYTSTSFGPGNLILGSTDGLIKMFVGNTAQANVIQQIASDGVEIFGNVSATGNITAGNITTTGSTGNITGANVISAVTLSASGSANLYAVNMSQSIAWPDASQIYVDTDIVVQGNVGALITSPGTTQITAGSNTWSFDNTGNLTTPGNISAVGNITASGLLINTVTGITSNAGNININQITGLGGYLNAIGANLSGNINAANLSLSGNIISDANISGNVNAANISAGNISLSGNIFAYGANIYSVNGLTMEGGNLTMSSITGMGGSISAEGNIIGANLSATGDITGASFNTAGAGGDLIMSGGNVTGASRIVTTPTALANLTAVAGGRAFVNDGNLVAIGNFGSQIGTGGSNVVPVWSDGANWYIG